MMGYEWEDTDSGIFLHPTAVFGFGTQKQGIESPKIQWEFQDPKMEVRKRTICLAIFWGYIPLHSPEK